MNDSDQSDVVVYIGHGLWLSRLQQYIVFGATEDQVVKQLGHSDKRYIDEDVIHLEYYNDKLNLWLENENKARLGWVEVKNPSTMLFGKRLIGRGKTDVIEYLFREIAAEPKWDDYGRLETAFFEHLWLELQFELGVLDSVNFGVLYDDNDQVQWPETNVTV